MILHTGWKDSAFNPKNWGGGGRDSKKSDTDKAVQQAVNTKDDGTMAEKNYNASFADDLSMGLTTFGLSGQAQIDKLVDSGYSESAARDFQARTAATQAANAAAFNDNDDNDNSSTTTTTTTTTNNDDDDDDDDDNSGNNTGTSATNTSTLDTSSDGSSDDITAGGGGTAADGDAEADQIIAQADGDAEAAVADAARKGRRGNILTTSQGLLSDEDDPNLRRRRSLMGGGLIS